MAIWNLKNLISLAAGVSASAVAVRKALGREVDRRADKAIAEAVQEARREIREQAHMFFSEGFIRFFWTILVKAAAFLFVSSMFLMGWVADHWSALALAVLFVIFTSYDALRAFPSAQFLWRELRKYGWRPKRILTETISAQVFETVLERAHQQEVTHSENLMLLLAGRNRNEMVEKLARAVAEVASQTSWNDIKPMLFGFSVRCALLFVLYSSLVWTLVWMIRH